MITDEILRLITEEREREVQAQLRVRRLLGPRRSWIRWHHRNSQSRVRGAAADRLG
jgi:hypothetical protein